MSADIQTISDKTRPVFEKYGVSYAALFGSQARGEAQQDSDVDIMVRLDPQMGLFAFMDMQEQLEHELGREVDIVPEGSMNKFLRPYILPEIVPIYERG